MMANLGFETLKLIKRENKLVADIQHLIGDLLIKFNQQSYILKFESFLNNTSRCQQHEEF